MTKYTIQKLETLEEELEIVELRVLEAIWCLERAVMTQTEVLKEIKVDLSEVKILFSSTRLKKISSVRSLNT